MNLSNVRTEHGDFTKPRSRGDEPLVALEKALRFNKTPLTRG